MIFENKQSLKSSKREIYQNKGTKTNSLSTKEKSKGINELQKWTSVYVVNSNKIASNFVQIASSKSPQKLEQSNLRLSPNKVNLLSPGSNNDVQSFHDLHSQYKLRNIKQIKSAGQSLIRKSVDDKECDLGDFIQENVSAQQIKSIPTHESVLITKRNLKLK